MITQDLVTIIGTAVVTIGGMTPVFRSHAKKIGTFLVNNSKPVANVVEDVVKAAEDVAKFPEFAELKLKLSDTESKLRKTEIARIAGAALHAYERGFDSLSQNEKGTLITLIRSEIAKVYPDVNDQEIISALKLMQTTSNIFKDTQAFKNVAALEQSLKALLQAQNQPTQTA
jgi:hypothetical protein